MGPDYLMNLGRGFQGHGGVAQALLEQDMNINALRPYFAEDGCSYINAKKRDRKGEIVYNNGKPVVEAVPVMNANTTLRKDEWIRLDTTVREAAKPRLKLIGDLRADGLTMNIDGMETPILQYQTGGDITAATISMDGMRESEYDRPEFALTGLPIPIIHKDFFFTLRELRVSRRGGPALDMYTVRLATRRVVEEAEKLALGVSSSYEFGGYTIYGITNFPSRNTATLTLPTAADWTGNTLVTEILAMIAQAEADNYHGPFRLYTSPNWNPYFGADYSDAKGNDTLRARIRAIEPITDIRTLDYLTGYQILLVQMTDDNIQLVMGMDVTTVQWESHGGMRLNFKVMAIMVPLLRADHLGQSGIVHGTAA